MKALGFIDETNRHHIVLISEWDTLYGQSYPTPWRVASAAGKGECQELGKKFIHKYSYLRGLDGQLPNVGGTRSSGAAEGAAIEREQRRQSGQRQQGPVESRGRRQAE